MKSSKENLSPTSVKLSVEVPFEELEAGLDAAYKRIGAQVNVPGFRKGKVPKAIIDQRFGRDVVIQEAIQDALPQHYEAAILEQELQVLGQPELDIDEVGDGKPFTFRALVEVRPEIELPDYKSLKVEVDPVSTEEDAVDRELDELRKRFATVKPAERPVADGDLVLVDVKGSIAGEDVEDYTGSALSYEQGSNEMLEGRVDETIAGLNAGDTATLVYEPSEGPYQGQSVDIEVTVKAVRERELPEADDEFAMLASEFDTLEELRADLADRVGKMALIEQGVAARGKLSDLLLELAEVPVPENFLKAQVEEHFHDGHGDEAHREEFVNDTSKAIKTQFILDTIADQEEIEVGQAELTQWLIQQAPRYGMTPDQFANALVEAGQVASALADVRRGKAMAVVLRNADITDTDGNKIDLSLLDETGSDADEIEEFEVEIEGDLDLDEDSPIEVTIEADETAEEK